MARPGKQQLNAWLSPEARAALERASQDAGVSMTALIEALGRQIEDGTIGPRSTVWGRLVDLAKVVDAERRGRRAVDLRDPEEPPGSGPAFRPGPGAARRQDGTRTGAKQ